ncbi:MAG: hypothetical protein ACRD7E_19495 [Bryobacteraceae bacterium]
MILSRRRLVRVVPLLAAAGCARKQDSDPVVDRDRKFQEMMSQVTLVGRSTRLNQEGLSGEERYVIEKVSKLTGDTWLFQTRVKYGSKEIPAPIPLTVLWAGDTPVITLTDLSIPGMGTYTARVLLYRDQYAGTWSGENVGGQLFGRIVREGG